MPEPVETTDPEGVDYAWVMQTTFVLTIVVGAPLVAIASSWVALPTWAARASFAIRVGAIVWILVALGVFFYARRNDRADDEPEAEETGPSVAGARTDERNAAGTSAEKPAGEDD